MAKVLRRSVLLAVAVAASAGALQPAHAGAVHAPVVSTRATLADVQEHKAVPGMTQVYKADIATPESLQVMYKAAEAAVDAEFPEMAGRIAIYNQFADPIMEAKRLKARVGDAAVVKKALTADLDESDAGHATPGHDAKGRAICIVTGWKFDMDNEVTNKEHSEVIAHEVAHCLDARTYDTDVADQLQSGVPWALQRAMHHDAESMGVGVSAAWSMLHGASLDELRLDAAHRSVSFDTDERTMVYNLGPEMWALHALWAKRGQRPHEDMVDFSGLRQAFADYQPIREANRMSAQNYNDQMSQQKIMKALYQEATADPTITIAQKYERIQKVLDDNSDLPWVKAAAESFRVVMADDADKPLLVSQGPVTRAETNLHPAVAYARLMARYGGDDRKGNTYAAINQAKLWTIRASPDGNTIVQAINNDPELAARLVRGDTSRLAPMLGSDKGPTIGDNVLPVPKAVTLHAQFTHTGLTDLAGLDMDRVQAISPTAGPAFRP